MFVPLLSNYLDPIQRSPNLDMVWSNKAARSEPNPNSNLGGILIPCSSSSSTQNNQGFLLSQLTSQSRGVASAAGASFPTTHQYSLQLPPESASSRGGGGATNDLAHNTNMVRNPKKRSRASRRAPTTVLTTDTTNFRAMVQEFTGIPAPPFTSSSPFPRTRFDLFASPATRSNSTHVDAPPYLLRPFAQKLHPPPPHTLSSSIPPSSSMLDTSASNHSTNVNSCTNSTSINYQLSSSSSADQLGLLNNVNSMHNPILSFQSILQQTTPKYHHPLGNNSSVDSHLKMGVLEELGLNNTHVGSLHQNMVQSSSDNGALSRINNMRNSSAEWAQRTGTINNNDGDEGGGGVLRSLGGIVNYSGNIPAERVSNRKVNFSGSASDFHGEKGPECGVTARGEGMVESWINCSSDN